MLFTEAAEMCAGDHDRRRRRLCVCGRFTIRFSLSLGDPLDMKDPEKASHLSAAVFVYFANTPAL